MWTPTSPHSSTRSRRAHQTHDPRPHEPDARLIAPGLDPTRHSRRLSATHGPIIDTHVSELPRRGRRDPGLEPAHGVPMQTLDHHQPARHFEGLNRSARRRPRRLALASGLSPAENSAADCRSGRPEIRREARLGHDRAGGMPRPSWMQKLARRGGSGWFVRFDSVVESAGFRSTHEPTIPIAECWVHAVAQAVPDERGDRGTPAYAGRRIRGSLRQFWSFKRSVPGGEDVSLGACAIAEASSEEGAGL